jgi:putative NADH-flavin reductase
MTAFVRNSAALVARPGLTIVEGDVTDAAACNADAVGRAVAGQEAVLSALGPRGGQYGVLPGGVQNIVTAMSQAGVRRLIHVSSVGVGDSRAQMGWVARAIFVPLFLRKALDEKEIEEGIIRASDVDWIIARPGGLEDGPRTGVYRCITDLRVQVGRPRIARADVADFMLQNLVDERFVRRAVGLTY